MSLIHSILSKTPDVPLYHYTSYGGFLGIVKSKSIWASNIHFQNDDEEFLHAIKIAGTVIDTISPNISDPIESNFLAKLKVALDQITQVHIYVASFSEDGDLLSQWRAYCPRGAGISISFRYDELKPILEAQGFFFAPCIYDRPRQELLMKELIEAQLNEFRAALPSHPTDAGVIGDNIAYRFKWKFASQAPILKHPSFSEEREWRVISGMVPVDHPQVDFREGPYRLIPYFKLRLTENPADDIPIKNLIIGPNPQKTLAWHAVSMLMSNQKIKSWGSTPSYIPYRAW